MSVGDVSSGQVTAAWLYKFGIDSHKLKPDHKSWLDRHVIAPLNTADSDLQKQGQNTGPLWVWKIWVIGTASRTASIKHNLKLSTRRAREVYNYIFPKIANVNFVIKVNMVAVGELRAMVLGKKDEIEDLEDRAVLVVSQKVSPEVKAPKPPKVRTPPKPLFGEKNVHKRRTALKAYAKKLARGPNKCQRLVLVIQRAAELVHGLKNPSELMIDDLEKVLIGNGLTDRGTGTYYAGFNRGASGFKTNLQDRSDQSAHAMAGIVIGYRHNRIIQWGVYWLEEEDQDDRLYDATFPLGRSLTDANCKNFAERVRKAIGGSDCTLPISK